MGDEDLATWAAQQLRDKLTQLSMQYEGLQSLLSDTDVISNNIQEQKAVLWDRIQLIKKQLRENYGATDV